jgi:hypothetical protein
MTDPVTIITAFAAFITTIADLIRDGASDEEIRERLGDPDGVAQDLLNAVRRRQHLLDFPEDIVND